MKVLRRPRAAAPGATRAPRVQRARVRLGMNRFYQDTRSELSKISWPSRDEVVRLSIVVILLSVAMAIFLGMIVDWIFSNVYRWLIGL